MIPGVWAKELGLNLPHPPPRDNYHTADGTVAVAQAGGAQRHIVRPTATHHNASHSDEDVDGYMRTIRVRDIVFRERVSASSASRGVPPPCETERSIARP